MANEKLQQLIEKRDAVNARIRREQAKRQATERKADTRRKVLAGAAVIEWAARDTAFSMRLMSELKRFLVREADRALFDFAPVTESQEAEKGAA